jgi:hypothetical protein
MCATCCSVPVPRCPRLAAGRVRSRSRRSPVGWSRRTLLRSWPPRWHGGGSPSLATGLASNPRIRTWPTYGTRALAMVGGCVEGRGQAWLGLGDPCAESNPRSHERPGREAAGTPGKLVGTVRAAPQTRARAQGPHRQLAMCGQVARGAPPLPAADRRVASRQGRRGFWRRSALPLRRPARPRPRCWADRARCSP